LRLFEGYMVCWRRSPPFHLMPERRFSDWKRCASERVATTVRGGALLAMGSLIVDLWTSELLELPAVETSCSPTNALRCLTQ
jgi:hypothetical protein